MSNFPHLNFVETIRGSYKTRAIPRDTRQEETENNKANREIHSSKLFHSINSLSANWKKNLELRQSSGLPDLPNENEIPVFLKIDEHMDIESLKGFGIEIISEEEDGYIIGSSSMDFNSLRNKIELFLGNEHHHRNQASKLWEINSGTQWRIDQILSEELKSKWEEIKNEDIYYVEVGIACHIKKVDQPGINTGESEDDYQGRLLRWRDRNTKRSAERADLELSRQDDFERLVQKYGGEITESFIDYEDSFGCKIKINGIGLKDITLNYQYVFEIAEHDIVLIPEGEISSSSNISVEILEPKETSTTICIIDSGIQEGHKFLAPAVDSDMSKSFTSSSNVNDVVKGSGHGTSVAGATLYGNNIPKEGVHELPFRIQNARVLDANGTNSVLPKNIHPANLMFDIVDHFVGTNIFNMSINSSLPCRTVHMSQWAAAIDKITHDRDKLFIVSAGNIYLSSLSPNNPGIAEFLSTGKNYPDFLLDKSSRISNPAQSCFALTVGSICHSKYEDEFKKSFGGENDPSAFSRSGLGLWNMIKPDVVEYGGDYVVEKNSSQNITTLGKTSCEVIQSTLYGASAIGSNEGTSFAAPKVAHIAGHLENKFPEESSNFYRSLIVQSARLPGEKFRKPSLDDIRHMGYGVPDLSRALGNSTNRITFTYSSQLFQKEADIFSVKIPEEIIGFGEEYDVLIEVTLSFTARTRRTRKYLNSYMSSSLVWESSKKNENITQFSTRILKNIGEQVAHDEGELLKWSIRENSGWSQMDDIKRQDNSLQKSWCILKSYELPDEICLAVKGRKGWEKDDEEVPYSIAVSFEALGADINLYELIELENRIDVNVPVELQE